LHISQYFSGNLYFVDPVKEIIQKLENKIIESDRKRITCLEIEGQKFTFKEQNPLIAICGVGGDLIQEIVGSIFKNNPQSSPIFILAPQNRPVELRAFMKGLGCGLGKESLVKDNGKYYEIMCVAKKFDKPLSLIGESAFDLGNDSHLYYLRKKREHYEFKSRKHLDFKKVVAMYDAMLVRDD